MAELRRAASLDSLGEDMADSPAGSEQEQEHAALSISELQAQLADVQESTRLFAAEKQVLREGLESERAAAKAEKEQLKKDKAKLEKALRQQTEEFEAERSAMAEVVAEMKKEQKQRLARLVKDQANAVTEALADVQHKADQDKAGLEARLRSLQQEAENKIKTARAEKIEQEKRANLLESQLSRLREMNKSEELQVQLEDAVRENKRLKQRLEMLEVEKAKHLPQQEEHFAQIKELEKRDVHYRRHSEEQRLVLEEAMRAKEEAETQRSELRTQLGAATEEKWTMERKKAELKAEVARLKNELAAFNDLKQEFAFASANELRKELALLNQLKQEFAFASVNDMRKDLASSGQLQKELAFLNEWNEVKKQFSFASPDELRKELASLNEVKKEFSLASCDEMKKELASLNELKQEFSSTLDELKMELASSNELQKANNELNKQNNELNSVVGELKKENNGLKKEVAVLKEKAGIWAESAKEQEQVQEATRQQEKKKEHKEKEKEKEKVKGKEKDKENQKSRANHTVEQQKEQQLRPSTPARTRDTSQKQGPALSPISPLQAYLAQARRILGEDEAEQEWCSPMHCVANSSSTEGVLTVSTNKLTYEGKGPGENPDPSRDFTFKIDMSEVRVSSVHILPPKFTGGKQEGMLRLHLKAGWRNQFLTSEQQCWLWQEQEEQLKRRREDLFNDELDEWDVLDDVPARQVKNKKMSVCDGPGAALVSDSPSTLVDPVVVPEWTPPKSRKMGEDRLLLHTDQDGSEANPNDFMVLRGEFAFCQLVQDLLEAHASQQDEDYGRRRAALVKLSGDSDVCTREIIQTLVAQHVPFQLRTSRWRRVFSLSRDGAGHSNFYQRVEGMRACLLFFQDSDQNVFGAFTNCKWDETKKKEYYGSPETFVFSSDPLRVYGWSQDKDNKLFIRSSSSGGITIGGGDSAAIEIDGDFKSGRSGFCETFQSPCLAGKREWTCEGLEVWAVPDKRGATLLAEEEQADSAPNTPAKFKPGSNVATSRSFAKFKHKDKETTPDKIKKEQDTPQRKKSVVTHDAFPSTGSLTQQLGGSVDVFSRARKAN